MTDKIKDANRRAAEKVMGWILGWISAFSEEGEGWFKNGRLMRFVGDNPSTHTFNQLWSPMTNIADAFEVLDKWLAVDKTARSVSIRSEMGGWGVYVERNRILVEMNRESLSEAITLAVIRAAEIEGM